MKPITQDMARLVDAEKRSRRCKKAQSKARSKRMKAKKRKLSFCKVAQRIARRRLRR